MYLYGYVVIASISNTYLKKKRKKVLIIDMDPQSNCTQSFFERYKVLDFAEGQLLTEKSNLPSIENIFTQSTARLEAATLEKPFMN